MNGDRIKRVSMPKIQLTENQSKDIRSALEIAGLDRKQCRILMDLFDDNSIDYIANKKRKEQCVNATLKDMSVISGYIEKKNNKFVTIRVEDKIVKAESEKVTEYADHKMTKERMGHITWLYMHGTLQNLTCSQTDILSKKQVLAIEKLFESIEELLSCPDCRAHFKELRKENPIPKSLSKKTMCRYGCFLHNAVNKRLKKPIFDERDLELAYAIPKP